MDLNSIAALSNGYVESLLNSSIQAGGLTSSSTNSSSSASTSGQTSDSGRLSPLAQILSTLQQLQKTNLVEYQSIAKEIATKLQAAAQTAQAQGDSTSATQLNQLATNFTNASTSGQLPDIQEVAKTLGITGGHHHYGNSHGGFSLDKTAASTSTQSNTSTDVQATDQALNPIAIMFNVLNSNVSS